MSTNTKGDDRTVCQRKEKNGTMSSISIPMNTFLYNKYMGGVDMADQFRCYYQWKLKSRKFYLWVNFSEANLKSLLMSCTIGISFISLLRYVASNTFVLLKRFGARSDYNSRSGYKDFRLELARCLIGNYNDRKRYALPSPMTPVRKRSTPAHYPVKGKKGRCNYCHNILHTRHESSIRCNRCDVALCIEARSNSSKSCFELYHTK